MTRVIHTGDTHIGYRQYHSPERRADFLSAFEAVISAAIEDDVDAVIHAGDLFHDRRPDLQDLLGTLSVLRRLNDAAIPFLAVVGNHESTRSGQWLDLFERLGLATRLGSTPVQVNDVAFYGLDHVPPSRRDDLTYQFDRCEATHNILVSHGLFTPFAYADWETEHVLEAATVEFDAVLLGDNHAPGVEQVDDTWVTYCGSTERASASEEPPRGYNIISVTDGVDIRRRTLDTRTFVFVDVQLGENEGIDRVREQVSQHELTDAVVIVRIDGSGEPIAPADVESHAVEHGALIARVTDNRDRAADAGREIGVEFADPDAAVDTRIGELGLSEAAQDIDEAVRASKVADSNVRSLVKEQITDRLDDGLSAFMGVSESDPNRSDTVDASGEQPEQENKGSVKLNGNVEKTEQKQDVDGQASMEEYR